MVTIAVSWLTDRRFKPMRTNLSIRKHKEMNGAKFSHSCCWWVRMGSLCNKNVCGVANKNKLVRFSMSKTLKIIIGLPLSFNCSQHNTRQLILVTKGKSCPTRPLHGFIMATWNILIVHFTTKGFNLLNIHQPVIKVELSKQKIGVLYFFIVVKLTPPWADLMKLIIVVTSTAFLGQWN